MGLLWDLIQQSQIRDQQAKADTLEGRVVALEDELQRTQHLLNVLLVRLEKHFEEDIDQDGRVG